MTTQDQSTTEMPSQRRYQVFWNNDGEYVSNLTYSEEQLEDINEIVFAVVRGLLNEDRFKVDITFEGDSATEGGKS